MDLDGYICASVALDARSAMNVRGEFPIVENDGFLFLLLKNALSAASVSETEVAPVTLTGPGGLRLKGAVGHPSPGRGDHFFIWPWRVQPHVPLLEVPTSGYGNTSSSMGIRDRPISARSPWQNGYAERVIGSIRRVSLS